jgi:hypothetical protein
MYKLSVFDKHKNHNWGQIIFIHFNTEGRDREGAWMITHNGAEVMVKCGQSNIFT